MKFCFLLVFICFSLSIFSQDEDLQTKVNALKVQIEQSKNVEQLMLLDSLSDLTRNRPEFQYDSIVRKTIDLAKQLDSISLAAIHTANLINFNNNILGKPEVAIELFNNLMNEYKDLNDAEALCQLFINTADSYYYTGEVLKSVEFYRVSHEQAKAINSERLMGLSKLYEGYSQSDLGNFSEASIQMKTAATHFRKIKDTFNLIGAKTGIAVQYSQVNFLEEANRERKEAIELCKLTNNYVSLVNLYFNTATDFRFVGNTQGRVDNIKQALEIHSKANLRIETEHLLYTNFVVALLENDELDEAETYFEKVVSYKELNESGRSKESFIEAKKWLLYKQGNYDEAIKLGKEYLELKQKRNQYAETLFGYKFLKLVLESKGDKLNAYDYSEGYAKLKDSMESAKNVKSLAFYQTLYETEKKSFRIEAQEKDIELLNEKSKVKNQFIIFGLLGVVTLFGLILLIRSRNRAKENQLVQEQFSKDLLQSQETERTRIAKDLHDSVGQQLTLIKRKAQDENKMALANLTNNALEDVRSISRGLYPAMLKQLGLTASIEQLILDYDEETPLFFSSELDNIDTALSEDASLNLYRCIQEILNNIIKHAQATSVSVKIEKVINTINISISDNGIGFDAKTKRNQNSLGLKTIAERIRILQGELQINSQPNEGTIIYVKIPTTS